MIIETGRLTLREMTQVDLDSLREILQDEETMVAYEGAFTDEETTKWLDWQRTLYREKRLWLVGGHPEGKRGNDRSMRPYDADLERPKGARNRVSLQPKLWAQRLCDGSRESLQGIRFQNPESTRGLLDHPGHEHRLPERGHSERHEEKGHMDQALSRC